MDSTSLTILGLNVGAGGAAAKFLLEKLIGPTIETVGQGIVPTSLIEWKARRVKTAESVLVQAGQILESTQTTPVPVPGRILWRLLEKSSLEEDRELQKRWVALLANAASIPNRVLPAFVSILGELSPIEAELLIRLQTVRKEMWVHRKSRDHDAFALAQLELQAPQLAVFLKLETPKDIEVFIANLSRLALVNADRNDGETRAQLSDFGKAFISACTAPDIDEPD